MQKKIMKRLLAKLELKSN